MSVCPIPWFVRAARAVTPISSFLLLSLLCACDLPSDHSLITQFTQKRAQFDLIRQMIDEDNLEGDIRAGRADPKMTAARLQEYRSLLPDAGIMSLSAHGKSKPFELIADDSESLSQGDSKGFLYDPAPQYPTLPSLDKSCFLMEKIPASQFSCAVVRSLGNGWWLIRSEYRSK